MDTSQLKVVGKSALGTRMSREEHIDENPKAEIKERETKFG